MNAEQIERQMRMQDTIQRSAFTLALAKHGKDEDIAPVVQRMENIQKSIQEQSAVLNQLQSDIKNEGTTLMEVLKPHMDKELEGIENAS